MSRILGLDVSTKTIGIAIFEDSGENGKLQLLTHITPKIKPKPTDNIELLIKKVQVFENEVLEKYSDISVESEKKLINYNTRYRSYYSLAFIVIFILQSFNYYGEKAVLYWAFSNNDNH